MFSGIIEELGQVERLYKRSNTTILDIKADKTAQDIKIGDSLSLNGVCLTVIKKEATSLSFEVMPQTLKATNLGSLRYLDKINLERALKVGERVSGHFVTGHIDCLGIIREKKYVGGNLTFQIAVPLEFMKYCIPRGSVALDGISLTIQDIRSNNFLVYIISYTLKNTTLGFKGPSDKVNVEFDILAKKANI